MPRFSDAPSEYPSSHHDSFPTSASAININQPNDEETSIGIENVSEEQPDGKHSNANSTTAARFHVRIQGAKAAKQEYIRTKSVRVMAEFAKIKSEYLEERNEISFFLVQKHQDFRKRMPASRICVRSMRIE